MHDRLATARTEGIGVTLHGVRRVFPGGVAALDGVELNVAGGEFVALLGPSGCGKSTLLRIVAGLDHADEGNVTLHDPPGVADHRRSVAFVFQDAHLLPWRTVRRNVALPLELMNVDRPARLSTAVSAIDQVGLTDAIDRYPNQLSGGMRMRVSLARALVTDPKLLLLDEPFAALDEVTRQRLDEQLRQLWHRRGMTVLFVTHSILEAAFLADRAIVLSRRPGRVILDHRLDLPQQRTAELRTETQFARQVHLLYEAMQREERTSE